MQIYSIISLVVSAILFITLVLWGWYSILLRKKQKYYSAWNKELTISSKEDLIMSILWISEKLYWIPLIFASLDFIMVIGTILEYKDSNPLSGIVIALVYILLGIMMIILFYMRRGQHQERCTRYINSLGTSKDEVSLAIKIYKSRFFF